MAARTLSSKNLTDLYSKEYDIIMNMVSLLYSLSGDETEEIKGDVKSHIVVKLPYLAKCRNPGETALSHMVGFYAACGKSKQNKSPCNQEESLNRTLNGINAYDCGDPSIIRSGMTLLKILIVTDLRKRTSPDRSWMDSYGRGKPHGSVPPNRARERKEDDSHTPFLMFANNSPDRFAPHRL